MPKSTKATFAWNETNVAQAVKLYLEEKEENGLESANSNDFLGSIAYEIGAKSAQSVRSKLSNEKAYIKAETPRKVGGKVRTQKVHYVRALQSVMKTQGVELTGRKLESLENATASDLQLIVDLAEAVTGEKIVVNPEAPEAKAPKQETAKA